MKTETITWHPASEPPDDNTTVLLDFEEGEPWPGYREAGLWYEASGADCGVVIAWADMPAGSGFNDD